MRHVWTAAPPVELHDHDPIELAAIAGALLRHHASMDGGGGMGVGGGSGDQLRAFVVVELGAGFGRWSLETVALARRLGLVVSAICVEAGDGDVADQE